MNNLDASPIGYEITSAIPPDLKPASHLIVLVPDTETDPALLAGKIREVANALERRVVLLALSPDTAHEASVRRRLVNLGAIVEVSNIHVESAVEIGTNWLNAARLYQHSGDVVVCFAEHRSGLTGRPLHQTLEANLDSAIYVISGLMTPKQVSPPEWISGILPWSGSIALILLFFWFQVRIFQPPQSGMQNILFYASLPLEAGSIWIWNGLFH